MQDAEPPYLELKDSRVVTARKVRKRLGEGFRPVRQEGRGAG